VLVLDEADRMLDMGFVDDVERIALLAPKTRQTVLFSATFDGAIARLSARLLRDAVRIDIQSDKGAPLAIEQRVHFADDHSHKHRILDHLLGRHCDHAEHRLHRDETRRRVARAAAEGRGHAAAALHGDMNQHERTRTITDMRRGRVRTLVATDVAARGIDVAGISHVINFDLPRQAGDYVHGSARPGAPARGVAVSIANHAERGALRQIERFTGLSIPASKFPARAASPRAEIACTSLWRTVDRAAAPPLGTTRALVNANLGRDDKVTAAAQRSSSLAATHLAVTPLPRLFPLVRGGSGGSSARCL
jgi:superfamily II DNA/RNA helicase